MFTPAGEYLGGWGTAGSGDGQFTRPTGVACGPGGLIHVVDEQAHRVQTFGQLPVDTRRTTWGTLKRRYH
jgi:hypothetical protein